MVEQFCDQHTQNCLRNHILVGPSGEFTSISAVCQASIPLPDGQNRTLEQSHPTVILPDLMFFASFLSSGSSFIHKIMSMQFHWLLKQLKR